MDTKACKKRILVFAGTYEGRRLAETFADRGWQEGADFCVATEYGSMVLTDIPGLSVIEGRMDADAMEKLMKGKSYGLVIDATHPYARVVTENIGSACRRQAIPYLRLLRDEGSTDRDGVIEVDSIEEAVAYLNRTDDRVLLTTGAKELQKYSALKDIGERAAARVLPSAESIESCIRAGIAPKHIIAMQGPFTKEMNLATMRQYGCRWLVTKNTGKPGGFDDKLACLEAGYGIIVIGRPSAETGYSFEEVVRKAACYYEE